jgi:hypothetical protein
MPQMKNERNCQRRSALNDSNCSAMWVIGTISWQGVIRAVESPVNDAATHNCIIGKKMEMECE